MTALEEEARADLRARQGAGARYDAPSAPAAQLAWARRGTAYFARLLNDLGPADLDGPSRVPGWSRRHVVAHVAYNGRAFANLAGALRTGDPALLYPSLEMRAAEIAWGATLPDRALRHLFQHAEVHLNVEWRDLTDDDWQKAGTGLDGTPLAVADTPLLRARELWLHALDLDAGARTRDVPGDLLAALATKDGISPDVYLDTHNHGHRPLGQGSTAEMPEDWPF